MPNGEQFKISSAGWYLVNESNYWHQKELLDTLLKNGIEKWSIIDRSKPFYAYLIHPKTLENSKGDFIKISVNQAGETVTEDSLGRKYKKNLSTLKKIHPKIITYRLDLIGIPKIKELPKSLISTLKLPDCSQDLICIQAKDEHYNILCSSNESNRDFYRHTLFEIVHSLKLPII